MPGRIRRAAEHRRRERVARNARATSTAEWHASRASTLERSGYGPRVAACATVMAVRIHCLACGCVHECPQLCGVRALCERCGKRASRRAEKRIAKALGAATRRAHAEWRAAGSPRMRAPRLAVMTLTTRDTGGLAADRAVIRRGHERLRAWLHRRIGAPPYVRVWETTCGTSGAGHPHAHVATVLPYLDYRALRAEWMRATDGASTGIHVSSERRSVGAVARYLAKYVSKGSRSCSCARVAGPHALPESVAAGWLDACAGQRALTASRGMLAPHVFACPDCESEAGASVDDWWVPSHGRWRRERGQSTGTDPPANTMAEMSVH